MTSKELYEKEFGNADSISEESVIRLLNNFAKALELDRDSSKDELIEFAMYLTGHDKQTIEQMYADFKKHKK